MWVLFAFISAALLGVYDIFKKISLDKNAVIPVLFLNVVFCCLIFLPLLIISFVAPEWIAIFLVAADFFYYFALSYGSAMISIVSLVRRSSVVVSFSLGALYFKERNLKSKAIDLFLVLVGMLLIFIGSR